MLPKIKIKCYLKESKPLERKISKFGFDAIQGL